MSGVLARETRSRARPTRRLDSLTGLRWMAALLVFGEHAGELRLSTPAGSQDLSLLDRALHALFGNGFIGVSCFFILSGFVLTWSRRPDDTARQFWQRRFAKIYPVFLVTTLLAVLLIIAGTGRPPGLDLMAVQAFLLQSWVPDQRISYGLNPVTWSLSCEAFFYFVFPALYLLMSKARTATLRWVAALCVLAAFLLPPLASGAFTLRHTGGESIATAVYGGPFEYWFVYVFPLMRLAEFACGVALACLVRRGAWVGPGVKWSIVLAVAGIWLDHYLPGPMQRVAGMFVPFGLLICALAVADLEGTWSPLRSRVMVFLGEISFSLYAVQLIILTSTGIYLRTWLWELGLLPSKTAPAPMWAGLLAFLGYLVICSFAAWLLYRFVERPMMRILGPRRPASGSPGPQEDLSGSGDPVAATRLAGTG